MKLLTVTAGPTWPGNAPLPAAGTKVGTVRFRPLARTADGTLTTIGESLADLISDGNGVVLKGSSGGPFKLLGGTRETGSQRAPRYTLEERLSIGNRVVKQSALIEPYESAPGSGTWDYRSPPPEGVQFVDGLPLTLAEIQGVLETAEALNAQMDVGLTALNAALLDLTTRSLGLSGLKVRVIANATTASGKKVLFGWRTLNSRLPAFFDDLGHLHIKVARIGTLMLDGALNTPALTTQRVTTDLLQAEQLDLPGTRVRRAPSRSNLLEVWTDRRGRKLAWIDDTGTFHIRKLGSGSTGIAVWGGTLASLLAPRLSLAGVVNLGIAGQTSGDVAARFGGVDRLATFSAAAPSGAVYPLTLLDTDRSPLYASTALTQTGRLGSVRGVLSRGTPGQTGLNVNRGGYYTFTPDAGAALELGLTLPWIPDNPHRNKTTLLAVGRHDLGQPGAPAGRAELDGYAIAGNLRSILQALSGRHDRFIVLGILNSQTEPRGAGLEDILAYNARIAGVAGAGFVAPRSVLCRTADGAWRADGTPDPAYMANATDPNAAGLGLIATLVASNAQERRIL